MASPQKENGHLRIANELVEIFSQVHLTSSEWRIIWAVWRKTWCWNKKVDWIALSQLKKATGLSMVMVCRAKKTLLYKRILVTSNKGLSFNKNYDDWVLSNCTLLYKKSSATVQTVLPATVQTYRHNNNYTKETIQKERVSSLKEIEGIKTGDSYQADGFSPRDRLLMKRRLEKSLGLKKANKWQTFVFGTARDFLTAFEKYQGYAYPDNVLLDEVSKTLAKWFELGETRETVREMLIAFFEGKKSEAVTVTPNSVFSSHTYNSWKQNKL